MEGVALKITELVFGTLQFNHSISRSHSSSDNSERPSPSILLSKAGARSVGYSETGRVGKGLVIMGTAVLIERRSRDEDVSPAK